jgi:hypothetical protein
MTLHIPRLPFSVDPLMAEAKRRARRRRLLLLGVFAGAVAAVTVALQSGSGPSLTRSPKTASRPPRQTTSPRRVSSIRVIHDGPLSTINMMVNNVWQGPVRNRWVLAYAGMWNEDPSTVEGGYEPALILYAEPINPNTPNGYFRRIGVYIARGSERSVEITAADGNVLSLIGVGPGSRGQSFRFNVATHVYSR